MESNTILDKIHDEVNKQVWFDNEHKYTACCVWPVATRFLWRDIKGFKSFPQLAFMSPEWNSGKSRALDVVGKLSYNAIKRGKYTPAVLLRYLDNSWKKDKTYRTTVQDEIDNVFAHGKDNADLVQFYNLGNEQGAVVARCAEGSDEIRETEAYCPKAFAGLKVARLPEPTKSRTIIVSMMPAIAEHVRPEELDESPLINLCKEIDAWAGTKITLDALKEIDLPEADICSFLLIETNKIGCRCLGLKLISDEWYTKTLNAAKYFIGSAKGRNKSTAHDTLMLMYKIYLGTENKEFIHTERLIERLVDHGDDRWMNSTELANRLDGYEIYPQQIHRDGVNKNGYKWSKCDAAWNVYLTSDERRQAEEEMGEDGVDSVDCNRRVPQVVSAAPCRIPLQVSTVSTVSTTTEDKGGRSAFQPTPQLKRSGYIPPSSHKLLEEQGDDWYNRQFPDY